MVEKKYNRYGLIFFEEPINHNQRIMIDRSTNPGKTIKDLGIKIDVNRTKIEKKRLDDIIKILLTLVWVYYTFAITMV